MATVVGQGTQEGEAGVLGESSQFEGVRGVGHSNDHGAVVGTNTAGGQGVFGDSTSGEGVRGVGHSNDHGAVVGTNTAGGPGIYGKSEKGDAAVLDGNVRVLGNCTVTGDVILANADCAEDFEIATQDGIDPGTVMVLDEEGALVPERASVRSQGGGCHFRGRRAQAGNSTRAAFPGQQIGAASGIPGQLLQDGISQRRCAGLGGLRRGQGGVVELHDASPQVVADPGASKR
jgi:hypothetical protein